MNNANAYEHGTPPEGRHRIADPDGQTPDQQAVLQKDLEALTPYRILDLVSRDLAEQDAHQRVWFARQTCGGSQRP